LSPAEPVEHFDKSRHDVRSFDCGQPALDRWLVQYAGQSERRNTSRTFAMRGSGGEVAGYYSLLATSIEHGQATQPLQAGTPVYFPIPMCLLARLAVDRRHQGRELGATLLVDAMQRVLKVSQDIGIRGLAVSAIDANAASFYRHFGFDPLDDEPAQLMIPLGMIERIVGPAR
jgi:GNAT superfamily N-acetyltransferase